MLNEDSRMADSSPRKTTETARQRLERRLSAIGVPVSALPFREAIDAVIAEERARVVAKSRDEIDRLRTGLQWILDNIDHEKAPLIVGRAKMALRG